MTIKKDIFLARLRNNAAWGLPCPKCGEQTKKSPAWLVDNVELLCICGHRIDLRSPEWLAHIKEVENIIAQSRPNLTPLK